MFYRDYLEWHKKVFEILELLKGATSSQIREELARYGFNPSKSRVYAFLKNDPLIKKYKIWSYSNEYIYCLGYLEAYKRELIVQYNHCLHALSDGPILYGYNDYDKILEDILPLINEDGTRVLAENTKEHRTHKARDPQTDASLWIAEKRKLSIGVVKKNDKIQVFFMMFDSRTFDNGAYWERYKAVNAIGGILDWSFSVYVVGNDPVRFKKFISQSYDKMIMKKRLAKACPYIQRIVYYDISQKKGTLAYAQPNS